MATKKKPKTDAPPIDVTTFGFTLPRPLRAVSSGEPSFDDAIAVMIEKCASMAKKSARTEIALPARLEKLREGDAARIRALLTSEALDLGVATFDLDRRDKEYLAAYRATILERAEREIYLTTLVMLALVDDGGEAHVRTLLPAMRAHWVLTTAVGQVLIARRSSNETLAEVAGALAIEGDWREVHMCWVTAAKAATLLGPQAAFDHLGRWISTTRASAVAEALNATKDLDPRWRDTLLPLAREGNEIALRLLARLESDGEILDTFAVHLQREADRCGFMLSQWAFDHLVAHADDTALARFPEGIANAIKAKRA